jgi:hypothetical protein
MVAFSERIARLKAWMAFLLFIVPVFICQFILSGMMMSISAAAGPADRIAMMDTLILMTFLSSATMLGLLMMWLLSVAFVANRRIAEDLRPPTGKAKVAAAFPFFYLAVAPFLWPGLDETGSGAWVPIAIPMHLLAMVGIFYVLGFAARNLIIAERQQPVAFFDYSGPFFLMWFFPIGVWFVQPRVNRLVEDEPGEQRKPRGL